MPDRSPVSRVPANPLLAGRSTQGGPLVTSTGEAGVPPLGKKPPWATSGARLHRRTRGQTAP
jgi:hypothetical protein